MRKIKMFIGICLCSVLLFTVSACKKTKVNEDILSIEVLEQDAHIYYENFNIQSYHIEVTYKDEAKEKEILEMNKNMISSSDLKKFLTAGNYSITVNYQGVKTTWNVVIEDEIKPAKLELIPASVTKKASEFKYSEVVVRLHYNTGEVLDSELTLDMVDKEDRIQLVAAGEHDVTVHMLDLSAVLHLDLLPNAPDLDTIQKEGFIYCYTRKNENGYISSYYYRGTKPFSSYQFRLTYHDDQVKNIVLTPNQELDGSFIYYMEEEGMNISYSNFQNISNQVLLFTITFTSSNQYENFRLDSNFSSECYRIEDGKVVQVEDFEISLLR